MESQNNESVANEKTSPLAYGAIKVDGEWFKVFLISYLFILIKLNTKKKKKDEEGRVLLLRGVNLGANAKLPANPPITSFDDTPEFFDHRNVSFVGRLEIPFEIFFNQECNTKLIFFLDHFQLKRHIHIFND